MLYYAPNNSTIRYNVLVILCFFLTDFSFGQAKDIWVRFYDTTTELSGYKDLKGNIKIPAKFDNLTRADTFYNIIAVDERIDSSYKSYYILKDKRKVGLDSVFMSDFTYDCESEGKILFRDKKKDRVGFFDKNGAVIIPAMYNYASPFRNGLAIAHRNAKRKCWGSQDSANCEHLGWIGGESILINEKNEVLVDSLHTNLRNINWHSLRMNDHSVDTNIFTTVYAGNGTTYTFVDFEKEFTKWFNFEFLPSLKSIKKDKLKSFLFPEITYWTDNQGWISLKKNDYLKAFPFSLTKERFLVNKLKNLSISDEGLNPFIFEKQLYKRFYDACGSHNRDRYPLFDVMLTYYKKRIKELKLPATGTGINKGKNFEFDKTYELEFQEHFEFIKTVAGYKLLSVSLKR